MPSHLHEALLLLFRNRPTLAPDLLRDALQMELPAYTEARIDSADLSDIQPAEYRADLVVLLLEGKPVMGIIVEVQLSTDERKSAQIAVAAHLASLGLDEDRSRLYFDLVLSSLSEAARRALQTMDPAKYEYQSDFARRYVAQGKAEGKVEGIAEGRAALLTRLLTLRFGPLPEDVRSGIAAASVEELDAIGERLLTAQTLQEAVRR